MVFKAIRRALRKRAVRKEVAALRRLTVGDIMTKYVITIKPEDDIIKAATKMIAEDISCLIVATEAKALGVLSERDFLRKVPLTSKVFEMKVKDIMTPNPVTVPRSMKLTDAVALMKSKGFRRLIVAEDDKMLGIITQTDFTRTLMKAFSAYPVANNLMLGSIMTEKVLMVTAKDSVAQAKQKMLKANVGAIIIVDKLKDPVPLGIFTEYDVVMQFYDQHGKLEMKDISQYMRKYVRAMPSSETIFEANRLMLQKNMRRLLIVDGSQKPDGTKDAKILGIVTQTDITRFVYSALDIIEKSLDDPKTELKAFSFSTEIHGEFWTDHLKVYDIE
jgi:CBS domain-containing protein